MKSIFGTGANISKEKDKNENAVLSGMTLGIIIGFIVFGFIALNIEKYIKFMNMDVAIYKEFALYSVIQLYIQLIFSYVLEKLYFENKNKLANKYCIILNILNFIIFEQMFRLKEIYRTSRNTCMVPPQTSPSSSASETVISTLKILPFLSPS